MEKSYYLTGWKLVSPTIPLKHKNYEKTILDNNNNLRRL